MNTNESFELIKNDLVQITEPNPEDIAEIVKRIIGGTPLREFGSKAGVSASTLSRIINGKISKPLSMATLVSIVMGANASSKEMTDLYIEMARANGMMSRAEQKVLYHQMEEHKQRNNLQSALKEMIFTILYARLIERGINVNEDDKDYLFDLKGGFLKNITEMGIRYDIRMNVMFKGEHYTWILWAFPYTENDYPKGSYNPKKIASKLVRELSPVFLTDSWVPELYADAKLTFCFADGALFECFCNVLTGAKLSNRLSAVLINTEDPRYIQERIFPSANYPDSISLFSLPPVMSINHESLDVEEEVTGNDYLIYDE